MAFQTDQRQKAKALTKNTASTVPPLRSCLPAPSNALGVKSHVAAVDEDTSAQQAATILGASQNRGLLNADQSLSSLTPVYLPCSLQHTLLLAAQRMLEDSLFTFGATAMREMIKEKGWDCAQCVELNDWVKILRKRRDLLPRAKAEALDKPLMSLLNAVVEIRHTAVHRKRTTAHEIGSLLEDTKAFLDILNDSVSAGAMSDICLAFNHLLNDLCAHKRSVQEQLRVVTREKKTQFYQLQIEEHLAVDRISSESQEYELCAITKFQQTSSFNELARDHTGIQAFGAIPPNSECKQYLGNHCFQFCETCIENIRNGSSDPFPVESDNHGSTPWFPKAILDQDAAGKEESVLARASRSEFVVAFLFITMALGIFASILRTRILQAL